MPQIQYFQDFNIFNVDPNNFDDAFPVLSMPNVIDVIFEPNFDSITITGFGFDVDTKQVEGVDAVKKVNGGTVTFLSASIDNSLVLSISGLLTPLEDLEKLIKKDNFVGIVDLLFGGNDTITFVSFGGNEGVHGGAGTDTVVYTGNIADYTITETEDFVTVTDNVTDIGLDDGTDTLRGVEFIQFADELYTVTNATGNGLLEDLGLSSGSGGGKGSGKSVITGTADDDDLDGTDGKDTIEGLAGNDTLNGGEGKDKLFGGLGDDTYVLGKGDKAIEEEGEGTDTVEGAGKLKVRKNIENATLTGTEDGQIKGNNEDNVLTGNAGDNKIDGKGGSDTITGGDGDDTIKGGKDADTFIFNAVSANDTDTIRDFDIGEDTVDLSGAGITSFMAFQDGAVQDGKNVVFTADNGAQLTLNKTDLEELSADDFTFAVIA